MMVTTSSNLNITSSKLFFTIIYSSSQEEYFSFQENVESIEKDSLSKFEG